ncbi:MAG TPA: hypothetical protein P5188_08210 [Flavobacterium sp.]|nr:hypothetical protein [Flavobacterium sp.]
MKWKFMAKTVAFLLSFLDVNEMPVNAEKKEIDFSAAQEEKLKTAFNEEQLADMKKALNKELQAMEDNSLTLKAIQDEIDALVKESGLTAEEIKTAAGTRDGDPDLAAKVKALGQKMADYDAKFLKLMDESLGDSPEAIIKNASPKVKHNATHLFASGKGYDALDRPWNRKAAALASGNASVRATDFTDQPTIQKLNDDMKLYYRENPTELKSLTRDKFGLPDFWPTRTKVDDLVADANIATAEISQARKLPWLPKNKQTIQAEEGKIFPIQIDAEFIGFRLQKMEASWLNMMNKEGSQPYKESFVRFLVSEIDKKARIEDRVATIKGIYVETPENATEAGRALNRQNGLLYLAQQARDVTKKYRPFDLGLPTTTNIVDYVDNFIKQLPQDVREQQGLVLYLSDEWLRAYKRRSETLFGTNMDYNGYPETPKDYPNVKFQRLIDMGGSDFMFLTFDDNIEILENVPAEKSMYKFEYLLRKMYIWADYKMGIRFIHIGNTVEEGDPDEFKVQTVWSNTAPVFPATTFIPFHENGSGLLKLAFNNVYAAKSRTSHVTDISNYADYAGQVIKIKGDTGLAATTNIVHNNAKIKLTGNANFDLKSGGTLTLFVPLSGVPFELSRTAAPETAVTPEVSVTTATIDANLGSVYRYGGTGDLAVTGVINGVEGKTITIYGNATADSDLTFSTTGNISMVSSAALAVAGDYVELTLVDGLWRETKRVIA